MLASCLCAADGADETLAHPFFACYNFMDLEEGRVPPPYIPEVKDAADATHFDSFDEHDAKEVVLDDHEMPEPAAFGSFLVIGGEDPSPRAKPSQKPAVAPTSEQQPTKSIGQAGGKNQESSSRACVIL